MAEEAQHAKVRLEISFKDAQKKRRFPEEEVTGVTAKGYEIVEVAGLVFRRRQKSLHMAAPVTAAGTMCAEQAPTAEAAHAAEAPTPAQAEMEVNCEAAAQPSLAAQPAEQQPAQEQEPGGDGGDEAIMTEDDWAALAALSNRGTEAERLMAIWRFLSENDVAKLQLESSAEGAQSLHSVAQRFTAALEKALDEGTLMCEEQQPAAAEATAGTGVQERAAIEGRLQSYKMEEAAWAAAAEQGDTPVQQAASVQTPLPEGCESGATTSAEIPSLQAARAGVHQKMAFQVECLCSMIATVEEMVALAELQCGEMQAEYHREKFRSFPHVDSPARLIHEIVRARSLVQRAPMRVG